VIFGDTHRYDIDVHHYTDQPQYSPADRW